MTQPEVNVYSQEYKDLLAKDTAAHRVRIDDDLETLVYWVYDPIDCNSADSWLNEEILGAEFARWNEIMRERFQRPARIIDLGCGLGGSSLWFAARGHDVIGIDACPELHRGRPAGARNRHRDAHRAGWRR